MRNPLLLGIDLTAATTVAVVEPGRGVVAYDSRAADVRSTRPGWAEVDPRQWWRQVCELLPKVVKTAGATPGDITAVAVAGTAPAVVLADQAAKPLRPAILPADERAVEQRAGLHLQLAGVDLLNLTGSALTRPAVAPLLMWLTTHEPEAWRRTAAVLGPAEWLATVLGATVHIETNWARASGLYTLAGEPADAVLDAAALSGERLAPVRRAGEQVGTVSTAAAEATGLTADTPIVAGSADHVLTACAAGLTDPGDLLLGLGDSGELLAVAGERLVDQRLFLAEHPVPGRWLPYGRMATTGALVRWVERLTGTPRPGTLDAAAADRLPATIVCQPYFDGEQSPLHDPLLRGSFVGLHLGHDAADLYRACLEATAYGFRQLVEVLTEHDLRLGLARLTGGATSPLWRQILADVLRRPLYPLMDTPVAAVGATAAAGVGTGAFADWAEAVGLIRMGAPVEPTGKAELAYEESYQVYRSLQDELRPASHRLAPRSR
ncbi:MAG: carbohydrate kinase [Streptosporangiales bacterium]|nr:carbohydrate kinase [Streptosporangiales bacterium]